MMFLDKTAALKHDVNSMFLISYAVPHKPVSSRTLAMWASNILQKAEVFIPKHLKIISSVQYEHQMRSVVVCLLQKLRRQLYEQM